MVRRGNLCQHTYGSTADIFYLGLNQSVGVGIVGCRDSGVQGCVCGGVVRPSNLAKLSKGVPLETKQACSIIGEASQNKQECGERVVSAA